VRRCRSPERAILPAVRLPCDDVGSGKAVVLLHAGIADRRMWARHGRPLADAGYRAVAPDLPGFGDAVPGDGELAQWSDVLETLDALRIDRFAVVGNSFGGAVALRVALCARERVTALALVSAPPPDLEPSERLQAVWEAEESAIERGDVDGAVEIVVDAWTLPGDTVVRDRIRVMQRRALELAGALEELPEAEDPVAAEPGALSRLQVPALVCAGEFDMPDFRNGAETLAAALPDARHVVITGAGHLAPLEQPAAFLALLLEFLAEAS
jgi:pimeloyl-ACP methyl ester carboxylesterase